MAKKKPEVVGPPAEQRPARELWRLMNFYNTKIKAHSKEECVGVIRNMQRLIDKGLGVDEMAQALENYEADEWRRANPRYSKTVRAFFTVESIKEWLTPRPKPQKPDPLARLATFEPTTNPVPAKITIADPVEETDL